MSVRNRRPVDAAAWAALLEGARGGSGEAQGQALEACRQYLIAVARHTLPEALGAKVGASDLVQETLLQAQQNFRRFQGDSEAQLIAWLRAILVNRVADCTRYFATAGREVCREVRLGGAGPGSALAPDVSDGGQSPSSVLAVRERDETLHAALARLPEEYRQVLLLRHRDDLSFPEIGRHLDRTSEAARKLWQRAVEYLEELLESSHDPAGP